jgi:molecular chaperone DnaK
MGGRPPSAHLPGTTGLQPPVDPWPDADHGWVPDPDATVPTPRTFAAPRVPPKEESAETQPISSAALPTRPVSASPQAAGKAATRAPKKAPKNAPKIRPSEQQTQKSPRPKPAGKPKRRSRRFVRFLQILFSIVMMIVVPLAALVLAYGWGYGEPIQDDAVDLVKDLADLLGIRS